MISGAACEGQGGDSKSLLKFFQNGYLAWTCTYPLNFFQSSVDLIRIELFWPMGLRPINIVFRIIIASFQLLVFGFSYRICLVHFHFGVAEWHLLSSIKVHGTLCDEYVFHYSFCLLRPIGYWNKELTILGSLTYALRYHRM